MCKIHTEVSLEETNCCTRRESGESQRSLLLNKEELNASTVPRWYRNYQLPFWARGTAPQFSQSSSAKMWTLLFEIIIYFWWSQGSSSLIVRSLGNHDIYDGKSYIYDSSWSCLSASHGQRLPMCLYIVVSVTFPSSPRNKHGGLKSHCCKSRIFWPWVNNKHVAS